jgi:crossover junction endodeoxyribonuclease RuvC
MIILGIDPGYAILGYGLIKFDRGQFTVLDYGVIETKADRSFPERLEILHRGVTVLIEKYKPDHVVFEELFFNHNAKTAIQVAAGRGVALLAAQQAGLPLYEYTPMQIKMNVTGDGHADKLQVQTMVKLLLKLNKVPKPDDAADALGAAICHASAVGPSLEEYRIK